RCTRRSGWPAIEMREFTRANGLTIFFTAIFLAAVALQSLAGWHDFNNDELRHGGERVSYARYLVSSEFGSALLENWQSEYLAVGSMAILSVYLRQRGSPESKPVGAPHDTTGTTG
ncbi:MAG: DUF6766 family protein, partial [Pseudonocardiaceae bacterium]